MKYAYLQFSRTERRADANIVITFHDGRGSKCQVGKRSGNVATEMSFGRDCVERNFLHEFGHALGFEHEHQRPDRKDSKINICAKEDDSRATTINYVDQVDPKTLAAASLRLDKKSIMIYPIEGTDIEWNQELSATDKAFTMLMYPGRTPDDMPINTALTAAGIYVQKKDTFDERTKGKTAIAIKRAINGGEYLTARELFITHNEKVLKKLQALYDKYQKEEGAKKGAKSKKKSDVETKADFDFFSTAVEEAVEWVANNPSDDNDVLESEGNGDEEALGDE
jgi:hypothetical protein